MANAFKNGDLVQLKSGGPPMTVRHSPASQKGEYQHKIDEYFCEWFKGATRDQGNFHEHVLQAYVAPAKK